MVREKKNNRSYLGMLTSNTLLWMTKQLQLLINQSLKHWFFCTYKVENKCSQYNKNKGKQASSQIRKWHNLKKMTYNIEYKMQNRRHTKVIESAYRVLYTLLLNYQNKSWITTKNHIQPINIVHKAKCLRITFNYSYFMVFLRLELFLLKEREIMVQNVLILITNQSHHEEVKW